MRQLCPVCGNEIDLGVHLCPHCLADCPQDAVITGEMLQKTVNLEKGMPLVPQALARLDSELQLAARQGLKVLTLIHGYGSSGEGGAIKTAVLRQLEYLRFKGRISEVIPGEVFEGRSPRGRQLLRRFPFLSGHRDLNRSNRGITVVIF